VNGTPGQQLFICNAAHDGWVMVNDDTATASAANAYTDSKVATEATARVAGDASTLSSANTFTSNAVAAEATLRAAGDAAAVASANAYTDGQVATINTSLAGKANLAGGNTFTGTQTLAPKTGSGAQASNSLQLNSTDGTTPQTAQLQARTDGGLSFQFGPTSGTPSEKASIDKNGVFTGNGSGLTNISGINVTNIPNSSLQNSSIGVVAGTGIGVSGTSSLGGSFTIANTGVLSFNGRNGLVAPQSNDYSFAQLSGTDSATSNLVYNNQANTYGAGSKQTFVASNTLAGLSVGTGVANDPSTPGTGDVWFNTTSSHLKFRQSNTTTKTLAFSDDTLSNGQLSGSYTNAVTLSNAGNSFTGSFSGGGAGLTNLTAANISAGTAGINISGNASTATSALTAGSAGSVPWSGVTASANTQALTVDSGGSLSPTGTGTITANFVPVSGGAAPTANGAIAYDSTANKFKVGVNGATNTLALLSGGNIFTTGKQMLAASASAFAALNFPNIGAVPTTPVTGDLWLTTGDNHLQFQSAAGLKSLAFTTDIAAGTVTGTGLTSGQLIVGNGGSAIGVGNLSGDVSTSGGTITTLASVGAAGTFTKVSTDVKGRVTAGTTASAGDLSNGTSGSGAIVLATSPALGGTPTAPTAAAGTNTIQIATTAFVQSAASAAVAAVTFIKDTSAGALPNKASAWVGNGNSGDGTGPEVNFEILMGETLTLPKFFCRLSTTLPANVTFQVFDSAGIALAGGTCVITTGSTSASSTGNTITLTAGSVYAVKATLATGTFGGGAPNAWWALGQ